MPIIFIKLSQLFTTIHIRFNLHFCTWHYQCKTMFYLLNLLFVDYVVFPRDLNKMFVLHSVIYQQRANWEKRHAIFRSKIKKTTIGTNFRLLQISYVRAGNNWDLEDTPSLHTSYYHCFQRSQRNQHRLDLQSQWHWLIEILPAWVSWSVKFLDC